MVKYSVVVCTYNGEKTIEECLESLLSQNIPEEEYEVIIVNDSSTDNVEEVVRRLTRNLKNVKLISCTSHRGLSAARNLGWKEAKGDFVFYIDDDAVADEDWVMRVANEYTDDVVGVGGYSRPYSVNKFSLYEQARTFLTYGSHAEKVSGAGGLNMSFKKHILREIGGFDPIFTSVADDADINRRLTTLGYTLKVVPSISVRHRGPDGLWNFCVTKFKRGKGSYLLFKKHGLVRPFLGVVGDLIISVARFKRSFRIGTQMAELINRTDVSRTFGFLALLERLFYVFGLTMGYICDRGSRSA